MKLAVIISGEYRLFNICRPTMEFLLNNEEIDIFVSTWDTCIIKNDRFNIDINEKITVEKIINDLNINRKVHISIDNLSSFVEKKIQNQHNGVKMMYKWKIGLDMVRQSTIEYDFILIIRPDLYFDLYNTSTLFDTLANSSKEYLYGSVNTGVNDVIQLSDFALIASPNVLNKFINDDMRDNYFTSNNWNIHSWAYSYITNKGIEIKEMIDELAGFTLCRPIPNIYSFKLAQEYGLIWTYGMIIDKIEKDGIEVAKTIWPIEWINDSLNAFK